MRLNLQSKLRINGSTSLVSRTWLEGSMYKRDIQSHIQFQGRFLQQTKQRQFLLFQSRDQHGYSPFLLHQSSSLIHHHHPSHTRSRSCCYFGCCCCTQSDQTRVLSCTDRHTEPCSFLGTCYWTKPCHF